MENKTKVWGHKTQYYDFVWFSDFDKMLAHLDSENKDWSCQQLGSGEVLKIKIKHLSVSPREFKELESKSPGLSSQHRTNKFSLKFILLAISVVALMGTVAAVSYRLGCVHGEKANVGKVSWMETKGTQPIERTQPLHGRHDHSATVAEAKANSKTQAPTTNAWS